MFRVTDFPENNRMKTLPPGGLAIVCLWYYVAISFSKEASPSLMQPPFQCFPSAVFCFHFFVTFFSKSELFDEEIYPPCFMIYFTKFEK